MTSYLGKKAIPDFFWTASRVESMTGAFGLFSDSYA